MTEALNYALRCRQADGPDLVYQMALGKKIINSCANHTDKLLAGLMTS